MRWKKKFYSTDIYHIYQRSFDKGVFFYTLEDHLIFFSIINHYAKRYKVKLPALCLMINHFHALAMADSLAILRRFMQASTSVYAKMFNIRYGKTGAVVSHSFGMSSKYGEKAVRTAISYVHNNPVEKKLVPNVEDYRWNFLSYAFSTNPFSSPIIKRNCRFAMRRALKVIDECAATGKYLNYGILSRVFRKLNEEETEQMADYIISKYSNIDYSLEISYYKDYDSMISAINSNTGSEYDLKEDRTPHSAVPYKEIPVVLRQFGYHVQDIIFKKRHPDDIVEIINYVLNHTSCEPYHVKRYFHLE